MPGLSDKDKVGRRGAPQRIRDIAHYWTQPPPEVSQRCAYWVERIKAGWRGNRRVPWSLGCYGAAEYLGVYIWEYLHVISPLMDAIEAERIERAPRLYETHPDLFVGYLYAWGVTVGVRLGKPWQ